MRDPQAARLTDPVDSTPRKALARGTTPRETPAIDQPPATAADFLSQPERGVVSVKEESTLASADGDGLSPAVIASRFSPRTSKTNTKILMASDDITFANAIRQHVHHTVQFTRTMLLSSGWLESRDEILADITLVLIELPHCRTASGTRNDRKIVDRTISLVERSSKVPSAMSAPRRSNSWQLASIHKLTSHPDSIVS